VVGVVDYKAGNAPSVLYALASLGVEAQPVRSAADVERADKLILPGVGAAFATMRSLAELGLVEALGTAVQTEAKPFLGVCVGLQVLFEASEETLGTDAEEVPCLGWFPGRVTRIASGELPLPHIGWNEVAFTRADPLVEGAASGSHFYFVNSYAARPDDQGVVLGTVDYGEDGLTAIVQRENVWATQFHVEKSGPVGLAVLRSFCSF
jgi:glutamine amidotransferase